MSIVRLMGSLAWTVILVACGSSASSGGGTSGAEDGDAGASRDAQADGSSGSAALDAGSQGPTQDGGSLGSCALQNASLGAGYCTQARPDLWTCPAGQTPSTPDCQLSALTNSYCCAHAGFIVQSGDYAASQIAATQDDCGLVNTNVLGGAYLLSYDGTSALKIALTTRNLAFSGTLSGQKGTATSSGSYSSFQGSCRYGYTDSMTVTVVANDQLAVELVENETNIFGTACFTNLGSCTTKASFVLTMK